MNIYKVGQGNILVGIKFFEGITRVYVENNITPISFKHGDQVPEDICKNISKSKIPRDSCCFEFDDYKLALKFYQGFFKTETPEFIKNEIEETVANWNLASCT